MQIKGDPWFLITDIAECLGWTKDNAKYHRRASLAPEEGRVVKLPTIKGPQGALVVSEAGLYKLVMRSDKPQARLFQDWVTREVLPSIRKTGTYTLPKGAAIPLPQDIAGAFAELAASRRALIAELEAHARTAEEAGRLAAAKAQAPGINRGRACRVLEEAQTPPCV